VGVAVTKLRLVQSSLGNKLISLLITEVKSGSDGDGEEQAYDGASQGSVDALKVVRGCFGSEDETDTRWSDTSLSGVDSPSTCSVSNHLVHADTRRPLRCISVIPWTGSPDSPCSDLQCCH
jgi:hypothetical protein